MKQLTNLPRHDYRDLWIAATRINPQLTWVMKHVQVKLVLVVDDQDLLDPLALTCS